MATTTDELLVKVVVDSSGAVKGFKTAEGKLISLKDALGSGSDEARKFEKTMASAGAKAVIFNQAIELGQRAVSAIVGPIKAAIGAHLEAERAEIRLANALRVRGQLTKATLGDLKNYAEQVEKNAGLDGKSAIEMLSVAKAMGFSNSMAKQLVDTAADLSAAFGIEATTAFNQLTEATQKGAAESLTKYLPALKSLTAEQVYAGDAVRQLAAAYGDFAESQAKELPNQVDLLGKSLDGLTEDIGAVISTLIGFEESVRSSNQSVSEFRETVQSLNGVARNVHDAFAGLDWGEIGKSAAIVGAAFGAVAIGAGGLTAALALLNPLMIAAAGVLAVIAIKAVIVTTAVVAVAAAVDILYRNFNRLPEIAQIIGRGFAVLFNQFQIWIKKLILSFAELQLKILETFGATEAIERTRKQIADLSSSIIDDYNDIARHGDAIKDIGKDIDTGFAGQGVKFFKTALADSAASAGDLKSNLAAALAVGATAGAGGADESDKDTRGPRAPDPGDLKAYQDALKAIRAENAAIGKEMAAIGAGQIQQIELSLRAELERIDAKREELKLAGQLRGEAIALLSEQEKLVRLRADRTIDQAQLNSIRDLKSETAAIYAQSQAIGLGTVASLKAQRDQQIALLRIKEQQLRVDGLLSDSAKVELETQRQIINAMFEKQRATAQLDAVRSLKSETAGMYREAEAFNLGTMAALKAQHSQHLATLRVKEQQLRVDGLLTASAKDELATQRAIVDAQYEKQRIAAQDQSLQKLKTETAALYRESESFNVGQLEALDKQHQAQIAALRVKEQQLAVDGLLNASAKQELKTQRALVDSMNARKKAAAKNVVTADQREGISSVFGKATGSAVSAVGAAVGGFAGPVGAMMGAANAVLDAVQQIIDFIPTILNKIAGIFSSLAELPSKILGGVRNIMQSVVKFAQKFLPDLLRAIPDILDSLIGGLLERLPDAVSKMMESVPDLIVRIFDRLPDLIERFVNGVITLLPKAIESLQKLLPKMVPALIRAVIRAVPAIVKAIVNGIIDGLRQAAASLFGGQKIKLDTAGISDSLKEIGKQATGVTDNLFKVVDLAAQAKGMGLADDMRNAIDSATSRAVNLWRQLFDFLKKLWAGLLDALQKVWDTLVQIWRTVWDFAVEAWRALWSWIDEKILTPLTQALITAWRWVYDNIIEPLATVVSNAFQWVVDNILTPIAMAVQTAFQWVVDNVISPLATAVSTAFQWVVEKVITPLMSIGQSAFQWVYDNVISKIVGFKWPALPEIFSKIVAFKWPELPAAVSATLNSLVAFKWPAFPAQPAWLASFKWPSIPSLPKSIDDFKWPSMPSLRPSVRDFDWPDVPSLPRSLRDFRWPSISFDTETFRQMGGKIWDGLYSSLIRFDWGSLIKIPGTSGSSGGFKLPGLATGGLVQKQPRYAAGGEFVAFSPRGTDTEPYMLTPGEFVVREPSVRKIGRAAMEGINRTGSIPAGETTVNNTYEINLSVSGGGDPEKIAQVVLSKIKMMSERGSYVVSAKGVR